MKVFFSQLSEYKIEKLIINSLEQALYQAVVVIDGQERVVWETDKKTVLSRNLMQLREQFQHLAIDLTVLRHESPYDEMIGLSEQKTSNRMEVPLNKNPYMVLKTLH